LGASGLYLLWSRRLGLLWDRRVLWASLICVAVFAPWYGWVAADTKAEFLRGFFLTHNVGRFLHPMEGHTGGPTGTGSVLRYATQGLYYPLVLLAGLAPWSVFLGLAGWYGSGRRARADDKAAPGVYRFLWCWIAVYFVFFTLAGTKLPNYILPLYAPTALLVARFLERWRRAILVPSRWMMPAGLLLFASIGLAVTIALLIAGRMLSLPNLAVCAATGALPVLGAGLAGWLMRRQRRGPALATLATVAVAFVSILAAWAVPAVDVAKAPRPLVQEMFQDQSEREFRVATYRYFQPSLVFYTHRQVWTLVSDEQALEQLRYPVTVYLFLPAAEWERLQPELTTPCRLVARHRDLYRRYDVVLVTNR